MLFRTVFLINSIDLFNDIVGNVKVWFQNRDCAERTMIRTSPGCIGKIVVPCRVFIVGFFKNIVIEGKLIYIDVIIVTHNGSICKQACQNMRTFDAGGINYLVRHKRCHNATNIQRINIVNKTHIMIDCFDRNCKIKSEQRCYINSVPHFRINTRLCPFDKMYFVAKHFMVSTNFHQTHWWVFVFVIRLY